MLTVTPAARDRLLAKLVSKSASEDVALRVIERKGRWRLRRDRLRPEDATYTHGGRNVLLLDAAVAKAMSALLLDVRTGEDGPRLRLRRRRVRS